MIPRNVRLSECSSFGKPILLYDVDSKGCVSYFNLAKELLSRNQPKVAAMTPPPPPPQLNEQTGSAGL
jgi:chromosome partitioning protein